MSAAPSLLALPADLLSIIASALPTRCLATVARTCRALHRAVWTQRTVRLPPAKPGLLAHLARFGLMPCVRGARCHDSAGVALLTQMPGIQRVSLTLHANSKSPPPLRPVLMPLASLPALHSVVCTKWNPTSADFALLGGIPALETIELPNTTVTDYDLASFARLERVKKLNLSNCAKLTEACVSSLAQLRSLRTLNLTYTSIQTEDLLACATSLGHLQELRFSVNSKAKAASPTLLAPLRCLAALATLHVYGDGGQAPRVLYVPPSLTTLHLSRMHIARTETPVASLRSIHLTSCTAAQDVATALYSSPSLLVLELVSGSEGLLAPVATVTQLAALSLWRPEGEGALPSLDRLVGLRTFSVATDHAHHIASLIAPLTNLTDLWVEGVGDCSDAALLPPPSLTRLESVELDLPEAHRWFSWAPLPRLRDLRLYCPDAAAEEADLYARLSRYNTLRRLTLEVSSSDSPAGLVAALPWLQQLQLKHPRRDTALEEVEALCERRGIKLYIPSHHAAPPRRELPL